ncbi:hypothetical protein HDV03_000582 [Kappamyces sp. JEL0829]|nr:hypothetical protein HDV03_000582 [Kappamyces sp. JEL0829]
MACAVKVVTIDTPEHLTLVDPKHYLKEYRGTAQDGKDPDKKRVFCSNCATILYSARDAQPNVYRVRVGTIVAPALSSAQAPFHAFTASAPKWHFDSSVQYPDRKA